MDYYRRKSADSETSGVVVRRRDARIRYAADLQIYLGGVSGAGLRVLKVRALDMSSGGIGVRSASPLECGQFVSVDLDLSGSSLRRGRVARCEPASGDDGFDIGIEFDRAGQCFNAPLAATAVVRETTAQGVHAARSPAESSAGGSRLGRVGLVSKWVAARKVDEAD